MESQKISLVLMLFLVEKLLHQMMEKNFSGKMSHFAMAFLQEGGYTNVPYEFLSSYASASLDRWDKVLVMMMATKGFCLQLLLDYDFNFVENQLNLRLFFIFYHKA